MHQPVVRCAILGRAEIQLPGIRLTPEAEGQFGLALFYCASAGRGVSREEVARLFWPEYDETKARHCLRQALYRLRALGIPVRSGAKTTTLDQRVVEVDYTPVVAEGATASDLLALTDMTVLPGYDPRFSAPFAAWVEGLRADVGMRLRRGLVRAIADLRSRGRYAEVERLARQCLVLDPLNEEATLALVEAVILAGGKVEAMEMIERYEREVGRYQAIRVPAGMLRKRISDWIVEEASSRASHVPLIGRQTELEAMFDAHRRSLSGIPQQVFITGEAGIGKTALLTEFLRMLSLRQISEVGVVCQRADRSRPLSVISELAASLMRLPGALGAAPESLTVLRTLTSYRTHYGSDTEPLTRFQIHTSFADLVDALSEECPLIIHIDDLQWIDTDSARCLGVLSNTRTPRRLLFVSCLRDTADNALRLLPTATADRARLIGLEALSEIESRSLLDCLMSRTHHPVPADTLDEYVAVCGGNPMYLVEVVRQHQFAPADAARTDLRLLIESRLQRLRRQDLTALQASTLLGKHATTSRVCSVLDMPTHQVVTALAHLEAAGMIIAEGEFIRPAHETIAEAALEGIPQSAFTLLHGRAAAVLESDAIQLDQPSLLWQAADHSEHAQKAEDTIRLLRQLAAYLVRVGSPKEAQRALRRALGHTAAAEQRWVLTSDLLLACRAAGDWREIEKTLTERQALRPHVTVSVASEDDDALLGLEAKYRIEGCLGDALPSLLAALSGNEYHAERKYPLAIMGLIAADGEFDAMSARQIMATLPALSLSPNRATSHALPVGLIFHTVFGDLSTAVGFAEEMHRRSAHLDSASIPVLQRLRWAAVPLTFAGQFDRAEAIVHQVYMVAEHRRLWTEAYENARTLAHISLLQGKLPGAIHWHSIAAEWSRRGNDDMVSSFIAGQAALIALCRGDAEVASECLQRASAYFTEPRASRARSKYLALKVAIEVRFAGVCSERDVSELAQLLERSLTFGENDLGVYALALAAARKPPAHLNVASLLQSYASARREQYSVPSHLRYNGGG